MALNLDPNRTDGRTLQVNLAAIERHLNDDHYVRGFTPGAFTIGGPAVPTFVQITAALPRWSAIAMPDAANSLATVSWQKPSEWRTGHIRTLYWFTSDVGSTNNFYIQTSLDAIRDGEVVPGTNLLTDTSRIAGPAVATTFVRSSHVYTTTQFGSDDELFSLRITRLGGDANDTNVNTFLLVHARIEHIPAQQVSQ